jgi:pSer/pThr/pTyr-binding forkhead associated (FHA) protein
MLKLEFNDGRQEPIWVVEKNFTLGSGDDNHLVIDDASVSPQHAKISCSRQTYVLKDLGSQQGTWVNGIAVTQHAIACLDVIKLGDIEIRVVDPFKEARDYTWSLIACTGFFAGREFPLRFHTARQDADSAKPAAPPSLVIGRSKHCDIAFPGTHLSKEHARFEEKPGGLWVEDLQSDNGVFVNDERSLSAMLQAGDKLTLDVYSFRVFGPGLTLPRSAVAQALAQPPEEPTQVPKQWVTRPTSPGNRSDAPNGEIVPKVVYVMGVALLMLLIGLTAFLFV